MSGITYLIAAYAIFWVGLFVYQFFLSVRLRAVQTELVAVQEMVEEGQKKGEA